MARRIDPEICREGEPHLWDDDLFDLEDGMICTVCGISEAELDALAEGEQP